MFFVFNDSSAEALFDEIARRYYRDIYKYCYSRLDFNKEDAEDCTQEAFISFTKACPKSKIRIVSPHGFIKRPTILLKEGSHNTAKIKSILCHMPTNRKKTK